MSNRLVTGAGEPEFVSRIPVSPPLPLILRLGVALAESGIAYCHWKSNAAIARSLAGDNDLDLLVHRSDTARFTQLLSRLGFVRTHRTGDAPPGIESFYGFDADGDRLFHVHAHYQLILGDDRTKNYRLPIEDAYVQSATNEDVFRLASPEFELVVFVIRMTLKYCTPDEIFWNAIRRQRAGPTRHERGEFDYLTTLAESRRVRSVLTEHVPYVELELFADCVEALASDISLMRRVRTARRLEIALQPYARRSRQRDRALRISRRITVAAARRAGLRAHRNRLSAGGAIVGIMGGDGSGKTTALAELETWLGSEFDIRVVHLGKPKWSATTYTARAALKLIDLTAGVLERSVRVARVRRLTRFVSRYRPLVWLLCTARDRHHAYRHAHRFAIEGGVVLCDRYPHPRLASMEVPLIASRTAGVVDGRLVRAMSRLEQKYHRSIAPPELLVVLRVDPEIAVARKTEERPESVRMRGAEIWNIDWHAEGAQVVDASQPQEAVAHQLKALIWSAIS